MCVKAQVCVSRCLKRGAEIRRKKWKQSTLKAEYKDAKQQQDTVQNMRILLPQARVIRFVSNSSVFFWFSGVVAHVVSLLKEEAPKAGEK
jgi:hypothetical protein